MMKEEKPKKQDEEKKKEVQKKYLELQFLGQQIKEVREQVQNIDRQLAELEATSSSIEEISKVKDKADMFVPLSSGVFVRAELKESKDLLVNVGASVAVKKPAADVMKMVDDQSAEIVKYRQQAMAQLEMLMQHAQKMERGLKDLLG